MPKAICGSSLTGSTPRLEYLTNGRNEGEDHRLGQCSGVTADETTIEQGQHGYCRRGERESTLYTTLEPCLMCLGTATSFFLGRIVFAMSAPVDGATTVLDDWQPVLGHSEPGGPILAP